MKLKAKLAASILLSLATFAASATLNADSLTGRPLIPSIKPFMQFGNTPHEPDETSICKSKMQLNYYPTHGPKVSATVAWHSENLSGFHKTHAYAAGRSQDTFYNATGTLVVSVTGNPDKVGEDQDTYSVLYARSQPGIPEKTIVGMNQQKVVCN
jgi:hypothetical protein